MFHESNCCGPYRYLLWLVTVGEVVCANLAGSQVADATLLSCAPHYGSVCFYSTGHKSGVV